VDFLIVALILFIMNGLLALAALSTLTRAWNRVEIDHVENSTARTVTSTALMGASSSSWKQDIIPLLTSRRGYPSGVVPNP
jgi:hypothetical protein